MIKILFVCHGNICRSPMAESIMKHLLAERGLSGAFRVDSAAVSSEELGNPVYPPAQRELQRRGLGRSDHRAWQISRSDYDDWDLFLCMDRSNVRWLLRTLGGDPEGKVHLVTEYTGNTREIEDPWYTDRFDHVYDELWVSCEALLNTLAGKETSHG